MITWNETHKKREAFDEKTHAWTNPKGTMINCCAKSCIALMDKTRTIDNVGSEVSSERFERITLEGRPQLAELGGGLSIALLLDPLETLAERKVGPVGAVCSVGVFRQDDVADCSVELSIGVVGAQNFWVRDGGGETGSPEVRVHRCLLVELSCDGTRKYVKKVRSVG